MKAMDTDDDTMYNTILGQLCLPQLLLALFSIGHKK